MRVNPLSALIGLGVFLPIFLIGAGPAEKHQTEGIDQIALEFDLDEGTKESWLQLQSDLESSARAFLEHEGFTLETSAQARRRGDPIVRINLGVVEMERCKSSATALLRIQLLSRVSVQRLATKLLVGAQHVPVWRRTLHFEIPTEDAQSKIERTLQHYLLELSVDVSGANRGARQLEDFRQWESSEESPPDALD